MSPESRERATGTALIVGLVVSILALGVFVWLGREILTGGTTATDQRLRALVHAQATPALTALMRAVSLWASPSRLTPVGLVLAVVFALRGWGRGTVLALIVLIGANSLDYLLKLLYTRARPAAYFDYPAPASYSFPSGHALFSACFFGGLAVLLSHRIERRWLRAVVWTVAVFLVGLVGLSRVYLGVHYPSDVLGGWMVGAVWVSAVTLGDRLGERRRRAREGAQR